MIFLETSKHPDKFSLEMRGHGSLLQFLAHMNTHMLGQTVVNIWFIRPEPNVLIKQMKIPLNAVTELWNN